jgi:hypothetical protein
MPLYYVMADTDDGDFKDVFVRGENAKAAIIGWQRYYRTVKLPKRVCEIPAQFGIIGWNMIPQVWEKPRQNL